ncbi:copper-translocating P-type ATPase [Trematosphaeria pertusa]|uniref:Copper-translocating P-type ATPase n=1 Tax=Trematosphaeria pertusa TaxID=390896 RepID=A0A6A6IRW2_9PLEO|nr:copper-translocating P-type ATPase [Trematosphaeria pertusa]KAF2252808.1 copper-translocating P-type ATPase [Trematosphaeria pertusa]
MPCGSGCCGGPKEPVPTINPNLEEKDDGCGDDSCSPDRPVNNDGFTSGAVPQDNPREGIAGKQSEDEDIAPRDDCYAPKPIADVTCVKGCCSKPVSQPPKAPANSSDAPPCCEGKASPCCDATCIERLALRECKSGDSVLPKTEPGSTSECHRGRDGRACDEHSQKARRRYQDKLEAIGCICRALIALGQESCCKPTNRAPRKTFRSSRATSCGSSIDSCCAPKSPICSSTDKASCADGCCGGPKLEEFVETVEEVFPKVPGHVDPEKGLAGREHVILSVSGMTCTGCETKLKRTIGKLDSVLNLKTSLVLARAEFDLDPRTVSAGDVIKHLERTTEFKYERVTNQGSSLDLIPPSDPISFVKGQWPDGVTDVRLVDKKIIRVDYDAKICGARHLLDKGWDVPMQLAPVRADPTLDAGSRHVRHLALMTLLSAIFTIPVLVLAWAPLPERETAYGSASLALATIVQVVIAGPFYPKAFKDLIFSRTVELDMLIVLSTSAAYIFSVVSFGYLVAGNPLSTGQFFETSTLLVTLIMVGRFFAALARQKAAESISIRALQTKTALVIDEARVEKAIDARLLQYGDVFKVVPDTQIPTDGTVISGHSEVDESMITGESTPVEKQPKSAVIAGSINCSGTLTVRLTRLPGDNTISTIASMVDEAKLSKPKIQDIADRVASYFVPVVVTLTIITFIIWIAVGVAVRNQSGSEATIQAITYAITVLIVSCPCAIGLAVPMVIVIASGVAAQHGVIFKSADSIEVAYKTTDMVFDKTGTLTRGELSVSQEEYFADDAEVAKSLLLGLVGGIKHPVSTAIATHLKTSGVSASSVADPQALAGKGVEGRCSGQTLRAGNSRWLGLSSHPTVQSVLSQGLTAFCFTTDGTLNAVYGLEDSLRPDSLATVSKLHEAGVSVHILSGDDDGAVRAVASQLQIPDTKVRSRCTPADKQAYIRTLLESSTTSNAKNRKPVVVFCGDGTNDAVALAQATIGIHMSTGTDVAKSAADVILMRPSLSGILTMIAVSKLAIHRIAFNFAWSFVYNLFAILLGAGAFVHARIPPEFAGLGELVSVLPVIAAAVALRWRKI